MSSGGSDDYDDDFDASVSGSVAGAAGRAQVEAKASVSTVGGYSDDGFETAATTPTAASHREPSQFAAPQASVSTVGYSDDDFETSITPRQPVQPISERREYVPPSMRQASAAVPAAVRVPSTAPHVVDDASDDSVGYSDDDFEAPAPAPAPAPVVRAAIIRPQSASRIARPQSAHRGRGSVVRTPSLKRVLPAVVSDDDSDDGYSDDDFSVGEDSVPDGARRASATRARGSTTVVDEDDAAYYDIREDSGSGDSMGTDIVAEVAGRAQGGVGEVGSVADDVSDYSDDFD